MNRNKQQQKNLVEEKEKLARDAAKLVQSWNGLDDDFNPDDEPVYTSRYEIPPPIPKDKSKYNPNNLVDIETFITHPFYLNLVPYPWQVLALKLFYAGIEGNTNVEFNDSKKEEETGCSNCVWNYVRKNEEECAKSIEKNENYLSILNPANSRCLKCTRCPSDIRETRLNHEKTLASDKDSEAILDEILESELCDLFQSEFDLIEEIPDEAVKMQIKNKLKNKFQELVLIIGRRGSKALDITTPMLTTDGWKTMEGVHKGDFVFGADGKPTKVIAETEIMNDHVCYRVYFANGEEIIADEGHEWKVENGQIKTTKELYNGPAGQSISGAKNLQIEEFIKIDKHFITHIEKLDHSVPVKCIEVDNEDHMYLASKSLIPTHNSFLTVTIALYELYRLLSMGHPQKKLKMTDHGEIHILNVATNEEQARDSIFTPMKNIAVASPFFQRYIGLDNQLEIKFLTDKDIEENKRRKEKGIVELDGTIILKCGSSSAMGMVGKTCWCVILDELAAMTEKNPNSGQDKKLYDELKPSIATFGKEGKIICLSNPRGPFGQLFVLYNTRLEEPTTLILKLPTEQINANIDRKWLEGEKKKDPIEYNMQYGAEFGTNSQDPYLTPEDVEYAFDHSTVITRAEEREPGYEYYCHVDPANRSDYYAIAVCHAVPSGEKDVLGRPQKIFIIDHLHYWAPVQMKQPVQVKDVEEYLIKLHSKFHFKQISFDQWHSAETIQKLSSLGMPVVLKVFDKQYKDKVYINLLEVFRNKKIRFYRMSAGHVTNKDGKSININEITEAKEQFTYLQKKWKNGRQIIEALSGFKDDICDACAAVLYECNNETAMLNVLPKSRIAYTGPRFR